MVFLVHVTNSLVHSGGIGEAYQMLSEVGSGGESDGMRLSASKHCERIVNAAMQHTRRNR